MAQDLQYVAQPQGWHSNSIARPSVGPQRRQRGEEGGGREEGEEEEEGERADWTDVESFLALPVILPRKEDIFGRKEDDRGKMERAGRMEGGAWRDGWGGTGRSGIEGRRLLGSLLNKIASEGGG